MANLSVDLFKSKLLKGGARPNLFRAIVNYPAFAAGDNELTSFMCKGAQVPADNVENIDVPFLGRQVKFAGDRTFEPLQLTIYNDVDFPIRNSFELWMQEFNEHASNTGASNPRIYQTDLSVEQLDKQGNVTKQYTFKNCYPTNLGQIDLNYETNNTIEEFQVTVHFDYWLSGTSASR